MSGTGRQLKRFPKRLWEPTNLFSLLLCFKSASFAFCRSLCEADETFCATFLSDYRFLGRLLPEFSKKSESKREMAFSATLLAKRVVQIPLSHVRQELRSRCRN